MTSEISISSYEDKISIDRQFDGSKIFLKFVLDFPGRNLPSLLFRYEVYFLLSGERFISIDSLTITAPVF